MVVADEDPQEGQEQFLYGANLVEPAGAEWEAPEFEPPPSRVIEITLPWLEEEEPNDGGDCDLWPLPDVASGGAPSGCEGLVTDARVDACGGSRRMGEGAYSAPSGSELAAIKEVVDITKTGWFSSPSPEEEYLIHKALAMLQENAWLTDWYCCLFLGPDSEICSCVMDWIYGRTPGTFGERDLKVRIDECDDGALGHAPSHGRRITICEALLDQADVDDLYGDGCAEMAVALAILHELRHLCDQDGLLDDDVTGGNQECEPLTYAIDNAMRDALNDRYFPDSDCPALQLPP